MKKGFAICTWTDGNEVIINNGVSMTISFFVIGRWMTHDEIRSTSEDDALNWVSIFRSVFTQEFNSSQWWDMPSWRIKK